MSKQTMFSISGINPEPWTSPDVGIGRKNGKPFPMVYKTETLRAYQEAIKDHFSDTEPQYDDDTLLRLHFYFWRQLPSYEIEDGRKSRRHVADATNLQKALEDALQGKLFKNDRNVLDIQTTIVRQDADTVPGIIISMIPLVGHPLAPPTVDTLRLEMLKEKELPVDPRSDLDIEDLF